MSVKTSKELLKIDENGVVDLSTIDKDKLSSLQKRTSEINNDNLLTFGTAGQHGVSRSSQNYIKNVRANSLDKVGDTLTSLSKEMKKINMSDLKPMHPFKRFLFSLPLVKSITTSVFNIMDRYDDISKSIGGISDSLRESQVEAIKDNSSIDHENDETANSIRQIQEDLIILELKRKEVIEQLEHMNTNPDDYTPYEINEAKNFLKNIETRGNDLNTSRIIMMQSMMRNAMIKQGNNELVQKINSALVNIVPIWEMGMAQAVKLAKQEMSIEKIIAFEKQSNEMLMQNSEMVKNNVIKIAEMSNKQGIDYKTLEKCHQDFIDASKELVDIYQKSRDVRLKDNENLKKLSDEVENLMSNTTQLLEDASK